MRKRGRTDIHQTAIVRALRQIGASVAVTSGLGGGFPDLVWSRAGRTGLMEIKTGNEPLTEAEKAFHAKWAGDIAIVRGPEEAQLEVLKHA